MAFRTYAKGARTERELIKMFSEKGYSVIRAAGSGVSSLCPDLLVFKKGKQYAFECKAWGSSSLGIEKEKFMELLEWERNTGITTMIAWRINCIGWRFMHLVELEEREKNYTITLKKALIINRQFGDLV